MPNSSFIRRLRMALTASGPTARKLILALVLFSSCVTLVLTAVQLYLEFRRDVSAINTQLDQVQSVSLDSLVKSVWVLDEVQVRSQLEGLMRIPGIEHVAISVDGQERWARGPHIAGDSIDRNFPLLYNYQGRSLKIGELHIRASLGGVYRRLIETAATVLISNAIKTFLVAGFMLFIIQLIVAGRLNDLASFARGLSVRNLGNPFAFKRRRGAKPGRHDEFDDVAGALERMRVNLKTSYDALSESEARFRSLVEGSIQGILIYDADFRVHFANQAMANMFGMTVSAIQSRKSAKGLLAHDDRDTFVKRTRSCLDQGEIPPGAELRGIRKDGELIWLEVMFHPVEWMGTAAVQASVVEVTQRKRAEEALRQAQKLEVVGQLTGGIAHDFNNLLSVIHGNLELLREDLPSGSGPADLADRAISAADRGSSLTQQLLAFARRQPLTPQVLSLNDVIGDLEGLLGPVLGAAIEVRIDKGDDIWPCEIDRAQLENALLNLAVNARDAMPNGGTLSISSANLDARQKKNAPPGMSPGEYAVLTVTDDGEGMPESVAASAFEPFFTTKDPGRGTGLGLSMVYGFIKQSGGHATIQSAPGEGTSVSLYLPKSEGAPDAPIERQRAQEDQPAKGGETVLLVEDNADVRRLAVTMLNQLGYQVVEAETGKSALERFDNGRQIDLMLTDISLPEGLSGIDILNELRSRGSTLPVICMTGYAKGAESEAGSLDEDIPVLRKPFRKKQLAEALRAALDRPAS